MATRVDTKLTRTRNNRPNRRPDDVEETYELRLCHYCVKCSLPVLYEAIPEHNEGTPFIYLCVKNLMLPALAAGPKYPCPVCNRPCTHEQHLAKHTKRCKAS
eukprot:Blabericola_migrator_1__10450@NODE_5915_length_642_cov_59_878261_g3915_i0_p1_GENE_NODE_5915_length_642_cov_59_878261_g3915_i0NODE_5915_length_642_cov_59_878261_g3915_i0_p1_ORF_typecomplete_len102_score12_81zfmet/PF12874_7/0_0029zf_C2H2_ZHX/PF18387_1/5_6zf_C2H2_ZHX/PF18387_1/14zf_C2H2_13/PF18508_1/0_29zf_C2H2_13/PF18508_1/6_2e02_NODE_5915_length_642_cov_59_878261_g3915_i0223528